MKDASSDFPGQASVFRSLTINAEIKPALLALFRKVPASQALKGAGKDPMGGGGEGTVKLTAVGFYIMDTVECGIGHRIE